MSPYSKSFKRSGDLNSRLQAVVPGGAHTYAKGEDQTVRSYPWATPARRQPGTSATIRSGPRAEMALGI